VLLILAACLIEEVSSDSEATSATLIAEALEEAQTRRNPRTLGLLLLLNGRSSGPCFLLRNPIQCEEKQTDTLQGARAENQGVLSYERQAQPDEGAVQAGAAAESAVLPHRPDSLAGE
jgi:hypothetical protein